MDPNYIMPAQNRTRDHQYRDALNQILKVFGDKEYYMKNPHQEFGTYSIQTVSPFYFKLENGFPLITERKISFWRKPIAEILAFIHGARTVKELSGWGCNWWEKWGTKEKCDQFELAEGDLGFGYGPGFVRDGFNQFEHLIKQIGENPNSRTHIIDPWIPQYCLGHSEHKRKVVVAPCHGWIHITIINGKLTLRMNQRSADFVIGVPSNIIQYAALTIMIAHVTGYEPYMYIHAPQDSQIYENQKEAVETMLSRRQTVFPTLLLTKEGEKVNNLFDFRPEHFELSDYYPHPAILNIPVTL